MRSIEGALRGLPEGSCLYQYTRVMSGFDLPRQQQYSNPVTQVFADDRLAFLEKTAGFRRIDLHWCLTLEPSKVKAFEQQAARRTPPTPRGCWPTLRRRPRFWKDISAARSGCGCSIRTRHSSSSATSSILKNGPTPDQLRGDTGVDRQIVKNPVAWHSDHLRSRQAPRPDVLAEDDARSIAAVPLLRPAHARLRQHSVLDMAAEVHRRGPQRDRRPGEVHLLLQSRRADARHERARYRFA